MEKMENASNLGNIEVGVTSNLEAVEETSRYVAIDELLLGDDVDINYAGHEEWFPARMVHGVIPS